MKPFLSFLAFLCFSSLNASAQNKELIEKIDESLKGMNQLLSLPEGLVITPEESTFDPENSFAFDVPLQPGNPVEIQRFFDSLDISQSVLHPYSVIILDKDEFDYLKLLGQESSYLMDHPEEEPVFHLKKIYFLDGTCKDAADNYYEAEELALMHQKEIEEDGEKYWVTDTSRMNEVEREVYHSASAFNKTYLIKSPRPVSGLDFEIELTTRTQEKYTLDKSLNKIMTPQGTLTLKRIDGHSAVLEIPYAAKDNVTVQALYKDGRMLSRKGYSCNAGMSAQDKAFYKALKEQLENAKRLVMDKEIKTEKELEQWLEKNLLPADTASKVYECQFTFSGPPSGLEIIIADTLLRKRIIRTHYDYTYFGTATMENYLVAADYGSRKLGIIDIAGNWIVQPQYEDGFRKVNNYFFWDQMNEKDDLYWFDIHTKVLKKVPYKLKNHELYFNKYMLIEKETNDLMGVVDAISGEVMLPTDNYYVWWRDGCWEVQKKEGIYGVYDSTFREMLPFIFSRIEMKDGFFFTEKENPESSIAAIEDIYNRKGENLTRGRFQDYSYGFNNGYIIAESNEREKERIHYIINQKYFIMDTTGNIVLSIPSDQYDVNRSEGINNAGQFIVEDRASGNKGFMNIAGRLDIPCIYSSVVTMFDTTAVVEQGGDQMIIDTYGKVIKKLPDHYHQASRNKDTGLYQIYLFNGEVYDERGNKVQP